MRKLIAVVTCERFRDRSNAVKETWGHCLQGADIRYFFGRATCCTECAHPLDVFLDVDDDYASLPAKVQAMFRWSVENGYDFTFKTDDDIYVVPSILCSLALDHDYIGRFRGPGGGYPASYAGGLGYWLSRSAAACIADAERNTDWAEDRWVGNTLAQHGFQGFDHRPLYGPWFPPLTPEVVCRTTARYSAVFCELNVAEMREMHAVWTRKVKPEFEAGLPLVWSWDPKPVELKSVTSGDMAKDPNDFHERRHK
jgi:galactosyltransferase